MDIPFTCHAKSHQATSCHILYPMYKSKVQWFVFQHVQGVARQGGHNKFHIAVVVVVGADESVSNEIEYAISLSFLPFSSIFFLSFCIPVMNCAVDPSEMEIGQEDAMPKAE